MDRVFYSLAEALRPEIPGFPPDGTAEMMAGAPGPLTRTPRGRILWKAFESAAAARARFVRRELVRGATRRGVDLATLDDKRRDRAMLALRDAGRLVGEAAHALREDIAALEAVNALHGRLFQTDEALVTSAAQAERIASELSEVLHRLNLFKGVPQIRTQREWDRFLSETASEMLDEGFSAREVAAILTGTPPTKVTNETLERFRQRVRRLRETTA